MRFWLISLLAVLPPAAVAAGQYSWFSDGPATSGGTQARPSTVGVDVYRSADDSEALASANAGSKVSLFGDYSLRARARANEDGSDSVSHRFANFGVRWQHRVSARDSVSVSAEQGGSSLLRSPVSTNPDALDTRATLSWTRQLSWAWKPSITGGVFLGDESARDDNARALGRRYYGFTLGGEVRAMQSHTPYVSFRMQRSLYDITGEESPTSSGLVRATEDSSRLAAGWRWQAGRGLSLQAEASHGFSFGNNGNSDLLPAERERSRVFFGTRFDY